MNQQIKTTARVVAVTSYLPFPLDRGDPVRVDMYLRALNEISDLTVLVTEREDTTKNHRAELAGRLPGAAVHTFRPASTSPARHFAAYRWLQALIRLTPSWIANRSSPEISEFLALHGNGYDYCFLLGEAAGQYASAAPATRVHWDKSNVLAASTRGDVSESRRWSLARTRLQVISSVSSRFERRVLSKVDQVSVTSASEANRMQEFLDRPADYIHASAVEPIPQSSVIWPDSKVILWMGSFQYHSNTNGLMRFIDTGLPILRSHGYTLRLVGSGASSSYAEMLKAVPGVDFKGFVPDLSEATDGVKAAVIPLWSGAGVKIKTLTLMGLGVPIAGTQTAFEGIDCSVALALAESPKEMAEACVSANEFQLKKAQMLGYQELNGTFSEERFFSRVASQISDS